MKLMTLPTILLALTAIIISSCNNPTANKQNVSGLSSIGKNEGNLYIKFPFDTAQLLGAIFQHTKIINNVSYFTANEADVILFGADFSVHKNSHNNLEANNNIVYYGTNIDSIIPFPNSNGVAYLVLFTTLHYDTIGEKEDCHACSAQYGMTLLSKTGDHFIVSSSAKCFDTAGAWGEGAKTYIDKFGTNAYFLHVSDGYSNQGETFESQALYTIPGGIRVFYDTSYYSNDGTGENLKTFGKGFASFKGTNEKYDDIEVTKTSIGDTQKANTLLSKTYYRMNAQGTHYIFYK